MYAICCCCCAADDPFAAVLCSLLLLPLVPFILNYESLCVFFSRSNHHKQLLVMCMYTTTQPTDHKAGQSVRCYTTTSQLASVLIVYCPVGLHRSSLVFVHLDLGPLARKTRKK